MSKKDDILSIMRQWAPEELAESWDNVGLQIDTVREIDKIALALEINLDTWEIISDQHYDLIITHHPLIFKPIYHLGFEDWNHVVFRELITLGCGLYVSHTNLDRASVSVTDALLRQFEFDSSNVSELHDGYGRVIKLNKPVDIFDIEDKVPIILKVIPDELKINTIAFLGGSGKSFIKEVVKQGIDLFITGELGYHDIQYLRQQKVGVILLGHYQSESFVLDVIKTRLNHLELEVDIIK